MSAPATARGGIVWAGVGMLIATLVTFLAPNMHNTVLILAALMSATILAWVSGKKVAMTDMPQMVALYNGMGGGIVMTFIPGVSILIIKVNTWY